MTADEAGGVTRLLDEMSDLYQRPRLAEPTAALFLRVLSDLSVEAIVRAIREHLAEGDHFPRPSELRQRTLGHPADREVLAWTALERAAARLGERLTVVVEDPALGRAILTAFSDWPSASHAIVTAAHPAQRHTVKGEFLAHYRLARQHQGRGGYCQQLLEGLDAQENRSQAGRWERDAVPKCYALGFVRADGSVESAMVEWDVQAWRPLLGVARLLQLPPPTGTLRLPPAAAEPEVAPKTRDDFLAEMREFVRRRTMGIEYHSGA